MRIGGGSTTLQTKGLSIKPQNPKKISQKNAQKQEDFIFDYSRN